MTILLYALISIGSYLLGAIPNAYLTVRLFTGKNIMEYGSGNVGTMNSHRSTNNKFIFLLTLLLELGKGAAAFWLTKWLIGFDDLDFITAMSLGALFNVLGHNYSVFLKFKGGKGLATAAGFLGFVDPILLLVWVVGFLIPVIFTRIMVLGQIIGTIILPIYALVFDPDKFWIVFPVCIAIFWKHSPRIKAIVDGTEPKMYYKVREEDEKE